MSYELILQDISGRAKLVAVSKLQSVEKIRSLAERGQKIFGENYVQEALPKIATLKELCLQWHFIGHLQKNKVKQVVGNFELIHSVDSEELCQKISTAAAKQNLVQKVLLEVNLSNEPTKSGFTEETLHQAWPRLKLLSSVKIEGLMTMPPLFENSQSTRPYFQRLAKLCQQLNLQELSMGTSSDYKVALEEGATIVRLGTVLFGERPRKSE